MLSTQKRVKRTKNAEQALTSLMRLCARAERSTGDARRLMATWEVPEQDRAKVLQRLIAESFIDDKRYAEAFVREKSRLGGWGEYKIRASLRRKGITDEIISQALQQISPAQSVEQLTERLARKLKTIKYKSTYDLKNKLIRHGLSLGYAMDMVLPCIEQLTREIKNDEEECDIFSY